MFFSGFLTPPSIRNILASADINLLLFTDITQTLIYMYMYRYALYIKIKLIVWRKQRCSYYFTRIPLCANILITKCISQLGLRNTTCVMVQLCFLSNTFDPSLICGFMV